MVTAILHHSSSIRVPPGIYTQCGAWGVMLRVIGGQCGDMGQGCGSGVGIRHWYKVCGVYNRVLVLGNAEVIRCSSVMML